MKLVYLILGNKSYSCSILFLPCGTLYSLLGLFSNALENSFDKHSLLQESSLDYAVATFYRVFVYTLIITLVGLLGWAGGLRFLFDWKIVSFGVFGALNSLSYTYALRRIEVTNIGTIAYIAPVFFLLIDTALLHTPLSSLQILGVICLAVGGIGFSIDGATRRIKKELSLPVLSIFIFWLIYGGIEAYFFKFMNATQGVNATTFFTNVWAWSGVTLLILVLAQRKSLLLFTKSVSRFVTISVFSKSCDVGSTLFTAQALVLASVSQVTAMGALSPLVLFAVASLLQGIFRVSLNERLDRANFMWKFAMILLLVAGSFAVR